MKHGLIAAVLLFGSCYSIWSQTGSISQQWFEYPFDPVLTVTIPENFQVLDTLGSKKVVATAEHGAITLVSMPAHSRMTVRSEPALLELYASFLQNVLMNQQRDRLVKSEKIRIRELTGIRCLIKETDETLGLQTHCLCLFVHGKMYVISFLEQESLTQEAAADRERLFASIQLPKDLTISSQMAPGASGGVNPAAYLAGWITGVVTILLLLLFAAVRIWGRPWNPSGTAG